MDSEDPETFDWVPSDYYFSQEGLPSWMLDSDEPFEDY